MWLEIEKRLYDQVVHSASGLDYETGGFIGIRDNKVCMWSFDKGIKSEQGGIYCPNKDHFHTIIRRWEKEKITNLGIVHTHLNGNPKLSKEDIRYINSIFENNETLMEMVFPVIIPDKSFHIYYAYRSDETILINKIPLKII